MTETNATANNFYAPPPHPLRDDIAGELHARPSLPLSPDCVLLKVALMTEEGAAGSDLDFVKSLCNRFSVAPPRNDARWYAGRLGDVFLRWERHTEMSTLTLFWDVTSDATLFDSRVPAGWPANWLEGAPGTMLGAVHMEIRQGAKPGRDQLKQLFPDDLALATPDKKKFLAATDFRLDEDGFSRVLVWADDLDPGEIGRRCQKLLEIDTYRLAALLSFPTATEARRQMGDIETRVTAVMDRLVEEDTAVADAVLLKQVSSLSARIEALAAKTSYRYSAGRAYHRLVKERLESLSLRPEEGSIIEGLPSYSTFLKRRLEPAMRTCDAMEDRQKALVERIARATRLLATRVEVRMGEQNAQLLASMDARTEHQLRLQETVEGLSVFAISYYAVGLISYIAKAVYDIGIPVKASLITGIAVPVVVTVLWLGLRRFHKSLQKQTGHAKR